MGGPRPWASPPVGRPAFTILKRSVCLGARFCISTKLIVCGSLERAFHRSSLSNVLLHAITPHAYSSVVASGMVRRVWHTTTENLGSLFTHHTHRICRAKMYIPSTFLHFNDMLFSSSGFPSKSVIILEVISLSTSPALHRNSNRRRRGAHNFARGLQGQCALCGYPACHKAGRRPLNKTARHHLLRWPLVPRSAESHQPGQRGSPCDATSHFQPLLS